MPKTTRDLLKGSLAGAYVHFDQGLDQIGKVHNAFLEQHPEMTEGLEIAAALIHQAQELIKTFWVAAWDSLPGDWVITSERK